MFHEVNLFFYGGAETVTGANYLLEIGYPSTTANAGQASSSGQVTKILIDCGLSQGESFSEKSNWGKFPYDPASIDAVLITHAHIDHTGRLPKLFKDGFKGKIYSTAPTKDFAEQLLLDSEHLLFKEAEEKNLPPLYNINDINETMKLWQKISYHEKLKIKDVEVEFFDAGHILGSAFIAVKAEGKTIVFSGDLGNMPAPLVKDTENINQADYALIESAYGARIHETPEKRKDLLEDTIEETIKSNGVLLIPTFAMERTQELLYELNALVENKKIPAIPVFVDSPLAIKLTAIYKKYSMDQTYVDDEAIKLLRGGDAIFDFPRLRLTLTTEQSKEINNVPPPKIIIAGSGMSHGGRILHHELRYLPDPNSAILFIGYQTKGSLGRRILEGAKLVNIFGETVPVRLKIKSISGYSAHADQPLLLNWLKPIKNSLKKLFIVQGEKEEAEGLSQKIKDELAINTVIPKAGEEYNI